MEFLDIYLAKLKVKAVELAADCRSLDISKSYSKF